MLFTVTPAISHAHSDPALTDVRLIVVAGFFPSRVQPWLLNSTISAMDHGADVTVVGTGIRPGEIPQLALQRGVIERTIYGGTGLRTVPGTLLRRLRSADPTISIATKTGLRRLLTMSPRPHTPRQWLRALSLATPIGLDPHLVHFHFAGHAYAWLPVLRALRIPFVFTFHGFAPADVPQITPDKMKLVLQSASAVTVNTAFAARQVSMLGCPDAKIKAVPQGLRLEDFPFVPRQYGSGERLVVLTVGRVNEHKGHSVAMKALAQLGSEGLDFEYRIVGDGPHRQRLEEQARALGIAHRVRFLGEQIDAELRRHYREAHIFILPSIAEPGGWAETQGVVLQEAQASGKVVIASQSGAIPEVAEGFPSTFLFREGDAAELGDRLRFVTHEQTSWRGWQEAARQQVEQRFSVESTGRMLAALYREIIDVSRAGSRSHAPASTHSADPDK
jgi:colanic acid/amylovoran biosynthesis glycosyltransferase